MTDGNSRQMVDPQSRWVLLHRPSASQVETHSVDYGSVSCKAWAAVDATRLICVRSGFSESHSRKT